jgi:hypothetical protein
VRVITMRLLTYSGAFSSTRSSAPAQTRTTSRRCGLDTSTFVSGLLLLYSHAVLTSYEMCIKFAEDLKTLPLS